MSNRRNSKIKRKGKGRSPKHNKHIHREYIVSRPKSGETMLPYPWLSPAAGWVRELSRKINSEAGRSLSESGHNLTTEADRNCSPA